jgi:hypothetical protein
VSRWESARTSVAAVSSDVSLVTSAVGKEEAEGEVAFCLPLPLPGVVEDWLDWIVQVNKWSKIEMTKNTHDNIVGTELRNRRRLMVRLDANCRRGSRDWGTQKSFPFRRPTRGLTDENIFCLAPPALSGYERILVLLQVHACIHFPLDTTFCPLAASGIVEGDISAGTFVGAGDVRSRHRWVTQMVVVVRGQCQSGTAFGMITCTFDPTRRDLSSVLCSSSTGEI